MKPTARQTGLLVLMGLYMALSACASPVAKVAEGPPPVDTIRNITVDDAGTGTRITVESGEPLRYTTFVNTAPPKFIVDLAGMTPGEFGKTLDVGKGAVSQVVVTGQEAMGKLVRVEVVLTEPVEAVARAEGNTLIIDVPHPSSVTTARKDEAPPAPAPSGTTPEATKEMSTPSSSEAEKGEVSLSSASVLSSLEVKKATGRVTVTITGDGSLKPDVKMVGQDRLVLDFMGTTSLIGKKEIAVKHSIVKAIRIGQHADTKMVRVVFDLSNSPLYDVEAKGNQVQVVISAQPESATGKTAENNPNPPNAASPTDKSGSDAAPVVADAATPMTPEPPATTEEEPPTAGNETAKVTSVRSETEKPSMARKHYTGRRLSLDFQDADVTNVIRLIADVSGLNVVVSDDVKGRVTLKLVNVPWDQALDLVLKMNDLGQVREGNILRIGTLSNITRQQDEEAKATETRLRALSLDTRVIYVNYANAKDIAEPLKKILSTRGEMTIDDRTNAIILKDVDEKIREIQELVQKLDTPTPQVQIEARIVEVNPTFTQSLGVQWGGNYKTTSGSNVVGLQGGNSGVLNAPTPDFAVNLPAAPLFGAFGLTWGQFTSNPFQLDLRLSAGVATGMTKIISTPKITVLDNQQAKIEQGATIPYATSSANGGTNTTFVDAKLTLTVTPHVTRDGRVIMKVKANNDEPGEVIAGSSAPSIRRKEATTNVLVKDGETTVIGGIYKTKKVNSMSGVPYLRSIPGLGWFFKTTTESEEVSELLIFLTPRIVQ